MKHKNELDFFEKIYIRKKAKHDVLNKCFRYILFNDDMNQLVKYDEVSTVPINVKQRVNFMIRLIRSLRKIMGEFHSDKINSYDQICLNDEKGTEETYFVVSQFIMTEIVKFIAKRDYILSNSYIIVFFPGDKRKRIRIKRVAKAVTLIESEINKLKKCKEDTERQFNSEFYELETKMNVSQEKKYAHKVSLYRSLMIKNQEKKQNEIDLIDKEINALYSEEKRILHLKQLELEHKRSHTFLRIQHYYESANRLNSNISIMLYNEDDLFRYTGLDFKALNDSFLERLKTVEEELEYEDK